MAEERERLFARIDALRDDSVALIQELVRVDSTTPTLPGVRREDVIGGETRCNEILRERYEQAGLETHWVRPRIRSGATSSASGREQAAAAPSSSTHTSTRSRRSSRRAGSAARPGTRRCATDASTASARPT